MSPHGDPTYRGITELAQLPEHQRLEIAHFFTIYRHLDPDTWVRWTSGRRHRHRILQASR